MFEAIVAIRVNHKRINNVDHDQPASQKPADHDPNYFKAQAHMLVLSAG